MKDIRLHCIYKHTCPDGKVYIGQTFSGETEHRWQKGNSYKGQQFYKAIEEYGWDNIRHEVIEDDIPGDLIDERERFYIKKYDSFQNGWNATIGGKYGGCTHKESALVIYVLQTLGHKDLEAFAGEKCSDGAYESINTCMSIAHDCYQIVTQRNILTRHRAGQRRKFEAEFILNTALSLYVAFLNNPDTYPEKFKPIIDDAVGRIAMLENNLWGSMTPSEEDEEYVTKCYESAVQNWHKRLRQQMEG